MKKFYLWEELVSVIWEVDVRPSVLGSSPATETTLNGNIVDTANKSEVTILTPVGSPRIPNDPEFLTILYTISNNRNVMVDLKRAMK